MSTAAEESRRLAYVFKRLSLPQCRVLASVRDLKRPTWWEALDHARNNYGGKKMGYRTVGVLVDFDLVVRLKLRTEEGHHYRDLLELSVDGQMVEPMARARLREEGMA